MRDRQMPADEPVILEGTFREALTQILDEGAHIGADRSDERLV
jgi:hypothetical protein